MSAEQSDPVQLSLPGTEPARPVPPYSGRLQITQIKGTGDSVLDRGLMDSISLYGLLNPITVRPREEEYGTFEIIAGRRRFRAWCELYARWEKADEGVDPNRWIRNPYAWISVQIAEDGRPEVMALVENSRRSANVLAELASIQGLEDIGYTEAQIAKESGMPVGTIRKRKALATLAPELLGAVRDGVMAVGTAEQAAKLGSHRQATLVEVLTEHGKVTADDVKEAKQATRDQAINQSMMAMLFDEAEFDTATRPGFQEETEMYLARVVGLAPATVAEKVERLVNEIRTLLLEVR